MPIARIITSMPEFCGGLVRDLNSRGFEVSIVSPEQKISGSPDLEIRLNVNAAGSEAFQIETPKDVAQQQEDIWEMLAAFHEDALTQNVMPVQAEITNAQEVGVSQGGDLANEDLAHQGLVNEQIPDLDAAASTPVSEELSPEEPAPMIDPELVPSMFNFASNENVRANENVSATEEPKLPQKKIKVQSTKYRDLFPARDGWWNFRSAKLATAAVSAAVIVLLIFSFAHHTTPAAVNSSAAEAQTNVPLHTMVPAAVVPVKSAVMSSAATPGKPMRHALDRETDIAEDTVVHYRNKTKSSAVLPEENNGKIRSYSDLD